MHAAASVTLTAAAVAAMRRDVDCGNYDDDGNVDGIFIFPYFSTAKYASRHK